MPEEDHMVAVRFPAIPVFDPRTGQPLLEARGAVGNIVIEGTTTPARLSKDEAGNQPIQQPITITPGGYIPSHWNQDGLERAVFVPISGTWTTEIESSQGIRNAAVAAVVKAEAAVIRAEQAVIGANAPTDTSVAAALRTQGSLSYTAAVELIDSRGGGGGGGAPVGHTHTADQISDVTPTGRTVLRGTPAQGRAALEAGRSDVTVGGQFAGAAAPASTTVTTNSTQTISGVKTFSVPPRVPDDSFTVQKIAGLRGELDAAGGRKVFPVLWVPGLGWDIPTMEAATAAGYRPGDAVEFRGNGPEGAPAWAPAHSVTVMGGAG